MSFKKTYITILFSLVTLLLSSSVIGSEKSVKHLDLPDVTSAEEAKHVFLETTEQLKSKVKLDAEELQEIHIITYSLEKAMAYYVDNMIDEQQLVATTLAEMIELIHVHSENNRPQEAQKNLNEYFQLADVFTEQL